MVHAILTFDTLAYSKKLIQAGFTEQQAGIQVETMAEITNGLVTKQDLNDGLKDLKCELQHEMSDIKHEMGDIRHEMKELEYRLVFKLTSVIVITATLFATLLGVFTKFVH